MYLRGFPLFALLALLLPGAGQAQYAYVASPQAGTVAIIDTTSNRHQVTLEAGPDPVALALSPDGARLYVANGSASTITRSEERRVGKECSS